MIDRADDAMDRASVMAGNAEKMLGMLSSATYTHDMQAIQSMAAIAQALALIGIADRLDRIESRMLELDSTIRTVSG